MIDAFIEPLQNVLATLAGTETRRGTPSAKQGTAALGEVSGLIELSGQQAQGSFAVSFSRDAALALVQRVFGTKPQGIDAETRDLVGEITNMVTGGAKKLLEELGYEFDMSVPTVLAGADHEIAHTTPATPVVVPLSTDSGDLFLEICLTTAG